MSAFQNWLKFENRTNFGFWATLLQLNLFIFKCLYIFLTTYLVIKNPPPNAPETEMKSLEVEFDERTGCDNTEIEIDITTSDYKRKSQLGLSTTNVRKCTFNVVENDNKFLVDPNGNSMKRNGLKHCFNKTPPI
jgi:hypothetical protein